MPSSSLSDRWLVLGAAGFVGTALVRHLLGRREVVAVSRRPPAAEVHWIPVRGQPDEVVGAVLSQKPAVVLNAAALASSAACAEHLDLAEAVNGWLPAYVAETCRRIGSRLLHLSTDQVFDGTRGNYCESDEARPLHPYGRTKRQGEQRVLRILPAAAVVRLNLVVGPSAARPSATDTILAEARAGRPVTLYEDEYRSPIAVADVCRCLEELAAGGFNGLLHLGGPRRLSRFDLGRAALAAHGLSRLAVPVPSPAEATPPRPRDTSFDTMLARGILRHPPGDPLRGL